MPLRSSEELDRLKPATEDENKLQADNWMFSLVGTLEVVWHAMGWGLAIIPGTLWFWILVVSWQHTKPEEIFQEGRSKSHASNLSHPDASSLAPELAAKIN